MKKPIDFNQILRVIKKNKKKFLRTLPAVLVLTYVFMCFIPRYYSCSIVLAPESNDLSSAGSFGSTLSSLGLGSLGKLGNNDAISPELYPDLLSSNDFLVKMFPVMVENKDGDIKTNYYTYLNEHTKSAWWFVVIGTIKELILPSPSSDYKGGKGVDVFSMDKKQQDIAGLIKNNISCSIDQKTYAIKITVKDQDAKICALIADSTKKHLQDFIIDYRTNKARNDYKYYSKLCDEAKKEYDEARRKYSDFADSHMSSNLAAVRSTSDNLENEMQLKYNIYSSMSAQKQAALAKIQESTPAFTTLQNATMPIKPAGPKRMFAAIGMTFLVFFAMTIYLFRKEIC